MVLKLLGLQVVIIILECTQTECENYISERDWIFNSVWLYCCNFDI